MGSGIDQVHQMIRGSECVAFRHLTGTKCRTFLSRYLSLRLSRVATPFCRRAWVVAIDSRSLITPSILNRFWLFS